MGHSNKVMMLARITVPPVGKSWQKGKQNNLLHSRGLLWKGGNGKVEFRIGTHMETGKPMVEVWKDGEFVAAIYGHDDGIQIVSKYLDGLEPEASYPPAVILKLSI